MSLPQSLDGPVALLLVGTDEWAASVAAAFEDDRASVDAAGTVEAALDHLRGGSGAVDCVLSAYDLPEANGVDLVRELGRTHPRLPVVL